LIKLIKQFFMGKKTKSKTSPKGGNRGCLCDDSTYSKECCDGDLLNQGAGSLIQGGSSSVVNTNVPRVLVRENG
jgi:hypothetical protein